MLEAPVAVNVPGVLGGVVSGTGEVIAEATLEDYTTAFDFGCSAVVHTIMAARPIMKAQGGGRIINIVTLCVPQIRNAYR